jgi:hypothetical protein
MSYKEFLIGRKRYVIIVVALVVVVTIGIGFIFLSRDDTNADAAGIRAAAYHDRSASNSDGVYDYTEAPDHIGEQATVSGTVVKVFTSKSGVTFFDYCPSGSKCPFSAVVFASDKDKFADMEQYQRLVKVTGIIRSYQGNAEMVLNDPGQIE